MIMYARKQNSIEVFRRSKDARSSSTNQRNTTAYTDNLTTTPLNKSSFISKADVGNADLSM